MHKLKKGERLQRQSNRTGSNSTTDCGGITKGAGVGETTTGVDVGETTTGVGVCGTTTGGCKLGCRG